MSAMVYFTADYADLADVQFAKRFVQKKSALISILCE
jgi:hypothetical protein